MKNIYIHFIDEAESAFVKKVLVSAVPRIGDEIRISDNGFYRVTLIVWVYDEPDVPYERVNIGVTPCGATT